jgi:phospho-N-acetylmuramoyl-pentapeptide-transferase
MGGLFFIVPSVIVTFIFVGYGTMSSVAIAIGLSFMAVGFIDDFIKVKYRKNEGLKAYQKIIFQISIALLAGFYAYYNGITVFHIPFTSLSVDFGLWTVPLVSFVFVSITNSVNLTDGLDGLASGVSMAYLICLTLLITMQTIELSHLYLQIEEYEKLKALSIALVGGISGFLIFNVSKARVFMGDTGSLSLGGFLGAISVFSSNSLFIPIIGIMFVASGISVIIQVLYFKRTKKRVFLMAPLHHHFQLKGYSETQISYTYTIITFVFGLLAVSIYA